MTDPVPDPKKLVSPAAQALRDRALANTRTGGPGAMQALRDAVKHEDDANFTRIAKRAEHTPTAQTSDQIEAP